MGDTACLMQTFSYASGISNEAKEVNPIHALGESISFGRFMSESLAWEKWSSFSHNRYVEEAVKYSQPGLVAQKKAYFEAHYKRIAAKKAAALLEQANATDNIPKPEFEGGVHNIIAHDSQTTISNSQVAVDEPHEVRSLDDKADLIVDANEYNSNIDINKLEISNAKGANPVTEHPVFVEKTMKVEPSNQLRDIKNLNKVTGPELSGVTQMEKPLLKQSSNSYQEVSASMSKQKLALSSSKSSVYGTASKNPFSPAKPTALIHITKENNATPITRKFAIDSSATKRSTPKSLHMSINITPAREPNKSTSPVIQKNGSSRVASSSSKALKDWLTPLRTPTMASMNGVPKHPAATPRSENRRAITPLDPSASGSRTIGPKWHCLSADCSKSLSACGNKSQSPILSASFSLRSDDRSARRKEKLEEKFNAKEAPKVQLQTKLKEKAETELRKLRQSLCFKAKPLPDFYKERKTPKNQINETQVPHPQSPKLGGKPSPIKVQGTTSLPPRRPSIKSSDSKHVLEKNSRTPTRSLNSTPKMIAHENTSPNIQHR